MRNCTILYVIPALIRPPIGVEYDAPYTTLRVVNEPIWAPSSSVTGWVPKSSA